MSLSPRRRVASLLMLASLALVMAVLATPTPPVLGSTELVVNGGFEDGLTGWTARPGSAVPLLVSSPVHGGTKAVRLAKDAFSNTASYTTTIPWSGNNGGNAIYYRIELSSCDDQGIVTIDDATVRIGPSTAPPPTRLYPTRSFLPIVLDDYTAPAPPARSCLTQ